MNAMPRRSIAQFIASHMCVAARRGVEVPDWPFVVFAGPIRSRPPPNFPRASHSPSWPAFKVGLSPKNRTCSEHLIGQIDAFLHLGRWQPCTSPGSVTTTTDAGQSNKGHSQRPSHGAAADDSMQHRFLLVCVRALPPAAPPSTSSVCCQGPNRPTTTLYALRTWCLSPTSLIVRSLSRLEWLS